LLLLRGNLLVFYRNLLVMMVNLLLKHLNFFFLLVFNGFNKSLFNFIQPFLNSGTTVFYRASHCNHELTNFLCHNCTAWTFYLLCELVNLALYIPVGVIVQWNQIVLKAHESLKYIAKVLVAKLNFSFYNVCLLVDFHNFIKNHIERSESGIFYRLDWKNFLIFESKQLLDVFVLLADDSEAYLELCQRCALALIVIWHGFSIVNSILSEILYIFL
jgi:hypothetical protein